MENKTIYYLNKGSGVWKKEGNEKSFFSNETHAWLDSNQLFYFWKNHPDNSYKEITKQDADKIINGILELELPKIDEKELRYCENGNKAFAVDINGNEFTVLDDMSLQSIPKGTIKTDWMMYNGLDEIDAKAVTVGTLFRISHGYTTMDEDFSYDLIVFSDGSIYVYQSETYCYEPQTTIVEKEKSEKMKTKVNEVLIKYKTEIDKIEYKKTINRGFNGLIDGKTFSIVFLNDYPFIKEIAISIKQIIEECYPGEINWNISISNNGCEIY